MALALMAALALASALKLGAAGVEEPLAVSVGDAEVIAEAEALALGAADLLDVAVLPGPREALEPPLPQAMPWRRRWEWVRQCLQCPRL